MCSLKSVKFPYHSIDEDGKLLRLPALKIDSRGVIHDVSGQVDKERMIFRLDEDEIGIKSDVEDFDEEIFVFTRDIDELLVAINETSKLSFCEEKIHEIPKPTVLDRYHCVRDRSHVVVVDLLEGTETQFRVRGLKRFALHLKRLKAYRDAAEIAEAA